MKFTWGHAAIVMPVTIVVVFTTVLIKSMQNDHKTELVTDDYYAKEINFQEQIDHTRNALLFDTELKWKHNTEGTFVGLEGRYNPGELEGEVRFFRPSDAKLDVTIPLNLNSDGMQEIDPSLLQMGKYQLQIEWTINDTVCYMEKIVFI